jgi:hypothetical protein
MAQRAEPRTTAFARALPWVSGLVLIAGIVAFTVVKLANHDGSPKAVQTVQSAPAKPTAKATSKGSATTGGAAKNQKVSFDASARQVASKFILTAVARKHLAQAWPLAGPAFRADTTYKEWLSGNISVVPFLDPIALAKFKIDSLGRNAAQVEVAIVPKNPKVKGQFFIMRLLKIGQGAKRHWVVNYWIPKGGYAVPSTGSIG